MQLYSLSIGTEIIYGCPKIIVMKNIIILFILVEAGGIWNELSDNE